MYLPRRLAGALQDALCDFPVILITGPRQSGKTTLVHQVLADTHVYTTLDDPIALDIARTDPNGFLDEHGDAPRVLDEIQYAPELLRSIKLRVDVDRERMGKWVLTGSQQFELMQGLSETLAGRVAILELLPFDFQERSSVEPLDLASVLWTGSYPDCVLRPRGRDLWVRSYLRTYVERDVRSLLNVSDLSTFEAMIGLCAARHGQELNYATVARHVGISQPTVKSWISVLEGAYLVHRLRPFYRSFGKRLIKSPKLYYLDPALVSVLTRQPAANAALAGSMGGALLEGWVVSEVVKAYAHRGRSPDVYFWRSHDGLEVDLLAQTPRGVVPIEVKLTATPTAKHIEPMLRLRQLVGGEEIAEGAVVCRVAERRTLGRGIVALPWNAFPAWFAEHMDS